MYYLDDSVYETSHRQSQSYEAGFQCSFTQKKQPKNDHISLRNCPGRLSSFRRFGACCDDARHCEQNGVVFEANFFAQVIEVYPPRSSFARPGPVDPKVRSVRRSDGSTEWWPRHRPSPRRSELSRATSSRWCSANVDILAANAQTLAASRRLHEALKSCSQRHLIYSMPRNYLASQPRRKLDHPNRSCRRLHGLGVAHRCTQSQEYFMRVLQSRPNAS